MTKIKYINCFGTSHTAGGGFEFETVQQTRRKILNKTYQRFKDRTQYNFSYPGQLQKLVENRNIIVKNFGKQGYGNQRVFRKCYDLINSIGFDKEEHLFLLEFSDIEREEFFCNELNSYVIYNYHDVYDEKNDDYYIDPIKCSFAKSYYYDTKEEYDKVKNFADILNIFFPKTFNMKNKVNQLNRELDFFISYLEHKKINWIITGKGHLPYWEMYNNFKDKTILFGDGKYFEQRQFFYDFSNDNKLLIFHETDKKIEDRHSGYIALKIISKVIYNHLCKKKYIDGVPIDIDWKYYKNMDIVKYISGNENII